MGEREVLAWTLEDIRNENLYRDRAGFPEEIPDAFSTLQEYMQMFKPLILEELRAETQAALDGLEGCPFLELGNLHGQITEKHGFRFFLWRPRDNDDSRDNYDVRPGSLLLISTTGSVFLNDQEYRLGIFMSEDKGIQTLLRAGMEDDDWCPEYAWILSSTLAMRRTLEAMMKPSVQSFIIENLLATGSELPQRIRASIQRENLFSFAMEGLNESQAEAVDMACSEDGGIIKLLQGPPGTG